MDKSKKIAKQLELSLIILVLIVFTGFTSACRKNVPASSESATAVFGDAPAELTVGLARLSPAPGVWKILDTDQLPPGAQSITLGHHSDPANTRLVLFSTTARPESGELFNQFLSKLRATSEQRISPGGSSSRDLGSLKLECRSYNVQSEGSENTVPADSLMHLEACLVVNSVSGLFFIQGGPNPTFDLSKKDFETLLLSLRLPQDGS